MNRDVFDLLVTGGTVVTSQSSFAADLAARDGRIVAIAAPGTLGSAREVLDARNTYVLPGVIDGHVHFREPGLEYKEDFGSGSRAAVMGGVTTVLEMPNTLPTTSTPELVRDKQRRAEEKAWCDFGVFGLLAQDTVEQLEAMAEAGVVGFKCFLGRSTGEITPPDDGRLLQALSIAAKLGVRCAFHAENDAILQHEVARLRAEGRTDPLAHLESRPVVAEVEAIQRACLFARVTGASIHILHLSSVDGLQTVLEWRRRGVDVSCEVTPQHCFLSSPDMARLGSLIRINPPIRSPEQGPSLLAALASGAVDMIATDHSPHLASEKLHENIWEAVSGFAGVETSLRLFLTFGVSPGRLGWSELVRATSEAPARVWGLYPHKGCLAVGSDADLTIVDPAFEDEIAAERLHGKNNLTPFEGQRTVGAAVATVLRGELVMRNGELVGAARGAMVTPRRTRRILHSNQSIPSLPAGER